MKLGTYGKLIQAIWPELNVKAGPAALIEDVLAKHLPPDVKLEDIIREAVTLPGALMSKLTEYGERQLRIEASLAYLVNEIEAAKQTRSNQHGNSDNDRNDHGPRRINAA